MNSPAQWAIIIGEGLAIIALAIGFANEPKIARWERRQIKRLKKAIRRRLKNWLATTLPEPDDGREIWGNR